MVAPFSLPIKATRFSHSTASKGDFLPSVKWREKVRPSPAPAAALSPASAPRVFPLSACFTVAISSLPRHRIPPSCGGTLLFYSRVGGHASLPSLDTRFGDSRERSRAKKRRLPSSRRLIRAKRQCTAVAAHSSISLTAEDRKSTRLNSSHGSISYAVFCLKKKNGHGE